MSAMSKLRSGKDLSDLYESKIDKYPKKVYFRGLFWLWDSSKSEKEPRRSSPKPKGYTATIPFLSALKLTKEKSSDPCLLQIFKEAIITIPLIDAIQNILSHFKFLNDLFTPSRKPKQVHLYKSMGFILLNDISSKRRDHGAHLIACEM